MIKLFKVKVLNLSLHGKHNLPLPSYATEGDDAVDLLACFNMQKDDEGEFSKVIYYNPLNEKTETEVGVNDTFTLPPHYRCLIPSGLKVELPERTKISVKSRSGKSLKNGIRVMNSPGTVDCPYRGVIGIILINDSEVPFDIKHGDAIAQGSLEETNTIVWDEVQFESNLTKTERADGGYGHSDENKK